MGPLLPPMGRWAGHYSSVSNRRPVVNKRLVWVLEALHGHFLFATGFMLRDRVVTSGEGGQPSMREQHKEYPIKRCVFIEVTSTLAAWRSSHLVLDLGRE